MLEIIAVLFFASFVVAWLATYFGPEARKRAFKKREFNAELEERRIRREEKKREWNQKINEAKRHLVGDGWRDPTGKKAFVCELFGDKVPDYLWYEFDYLNDKETDEVKNICWPSRDQWHMGHFGDLEGHKNLRVRNAEAFHPEIRLSSGNILALDQIGHVDICDSFDELGFPEGTVLFSMKEFYPRQKVRND